MEVIMTNRTIQQLIEDIKEQFIPYQNVTLHYEEEADDEDVGFNFRITQEYVCQCDHCVERRKFLGRQLVTKYPSNCFDLDDCFELKFVDLFDFRQFLYPIVCLDNFEQSFNFQGSYKDFYKTYNDRINNFFCKTHIFQYCHPRFLGFFGLCFIFRFCWRESKS